MKIALVGVTGNIGSCILDEALLRGHAVIGTMRDASKLAGRSGVSPAELTMQDVAAIRGADAAIVPVNGMRTTSTT